jgi:predicted dehydrogenase
MIPRIAVIGAGKFGEMHLRAFSQMRREGRVELLGVADIDAELLARRGDEYGIPTFSDYREMIARTAPHGVSVATPDFLHREIALHCLCAGLHVLVEKPLDVTAVGCRDMMAAAERAGRLLQVDFHKRNDPYHRELKEAVARGDLGEVQYGYAHIEDRIEVPSEWLVEWAAQSSPAWFLGVHMYDLIRWIVGCEAAWVCATGIRRKLAGMGIDTYDSLQAKIVFENGAGFAVDTSWVLPDAHEAVVNQGVRVVGSEGFLEVDTQDRGARGCFGRPAAMRTPNLGFFHETAGADGRPRYGGYGIESIQDFAVNVTHLLDGGSLAAVSRTCPTGRDGLEATRIAVAVHESAHNGGAIVRLASI